MTSSAIPTDVAEKEELSLGALAFDIFANEIMTEVTNANSEFGRENARLLKLLEFMNRLQIRMDGNVIAACPLNLVQITECARENCDCGEKFFEWKFPEDSIQTIQLQSILSQSIQVHLSGLVFASIASSDYFIEVGIYSPSPMLKFKCRLTWRENSQVQFLGLLENVSDEDCSLLLDLCHGSGEDEGDYIEVPEDQQLGSEANFVFTSLVLHNVNKLEEMKQILDCVICPCCQDPMGVCTEDDSVPEGKVLPPPVVEAKRRYELQRLVADVLGDDEFTKLVDKSHNYETQNLLLDNFIGDVVGQVEIAHGGGSCLANLTEGKLSESSESLTVDLFEKDNSRIWIGDLVPSISLSGIPYFNGGGVCMSVENGKQILTFVLEKGAAKLSGSIEADGDVDLLGDAFSESFFSSFHRGELGKQFPNLSFQVLNVEFDYYYVEDSLRALVPEGSELLMLGDEDSSSDDSDDYDGVGETTVTSGAESSDDELESSTELLEDDDSIGDEMEQMNID